MIALDRAMLWGRLGEYVSDQVYSRLIEFLGSPITMRVGLLELAFLVLVSSAWAARAEVRRLQELDPRSLEVKKDRRLTRCDTLSRKLSEFEGAKAGTVFAAINTASLLIVVGWIVPTIVLWAAVANYEWLAMDGTGFVLSDTNEFVHQPSITQSLVYALSQFSHGAALDVMEVFKFQFAAIEHNPHHAVVPWFILAYRTFVEGFAGVLMLAAYKLFRIRYVPTEFEDDLKARKGTACGAK